VFQSCATCVPEPAVEGCHLWLRALSNTKKPLACAKGFFWGRDSGEAPVGPKLKRSTLLRLLLLVRRGGRS
jgi:hypothetical protein